MATVALLCVVGAAAVHSAREAHHAQIVGVDVVPPHAIPAVHLADRTGHTIELHTLLGGPPPGRVALVFFGYTHCGDVCPTTLGHLAHARRMLGHNSGRMRIIFITTDPAHDTPEDVQAYGRQYDTTIVGLGGTRAQIDSAQRAFQVNTFDNGPMTLDAHQRGPVHPVAVYIVDQQGLLRHVLPVFAASPAVADAVRPLL
jgi:cytochrome oxidase Cu insertion factor (SCO1/SenC/PrrC family)